MTATSNPTLADEPANGRYAVLVPQTAGDLEAVYVRDDRLGFPDSDFRWRPVTAGGYPLSWIELHEQAEAVGARLVVLAPEPWVRQLRELCGMLRQALADEATATDVPPDGDVIEDRPAHRRPLDEFRDRATALLSTLTANEPLC